MSKKPRKMNLSGNNKANIDNLFNSVLNKEPETPKEEESTVNTVETKTSNPESPIKISLSEIQKSPKDINFFRELNDKEKTALKDNIDNTDIGLINPIILWDLKNIDKTAPIYKEIEEYNKAHKDEIILDSYLIVSGANRYDCYCDLYNDYKGKDKDKESKYEKIPSKILSFDDITNLNQLKLMIVDANYHQRKSLSIELFEIVGLYQATLNNLKKNPNIDDFDITDKTAEYLGLSKTKVIEEKALYDHLSDLSKSLYKSEKFNRTFFYKLTRFQDKYQELFIKELTDFKKEQAINSKKDTYYITKFFKNYPKNYRKSKEDPSKDIENFFKAESSGDTSNEIKFTKNLSIANNEPNTILFSLPKDMEDYQEELQKLIIKHLPDIKKKVDSQKESQNDK